MRYLGSFLKFDKLNLIKILYFHSAEDPFKRIDGKKAIDWEKIFTNYTSDKGQVSRIYELAKLNRNLKIQLKNGQMTWIDILLKRSDRWQICSEKIFDISHLRKAKPQWNHISIRMAKRKKQWYQKETKLLIHQWCEYEVLLLLWKIVAPEDPFRLYQ